MADSQKKRVRGRPKTVDRQRTIERAMENYWCEGVHALSLNEICRRADISKPGLYREFDSEDGLMKAVLDHYRQLVIIPLLTHLEGEQPFADVVEQVIVGMTADRDTPVGCLFTQMRLAGPRLGPSTRAAVQALELERRDVFEAWYQRVLASGEGNPAISAELAARYIDTQFTTVLVQMTAGEPPESVRAQARLAFRVLRP